MIVISRIATAPLTAGEFHLFEIHLQLDQLIFFQHYLIIEQGYLLFRLGAELVKLASGSYLFVGRFEKVRLGLTENMFNVFKFPPELLVLSFNKHKVVNSAPFIFPEAILILRKSVGILKLNQ